MKSRSEYIIKLPLPHHTMMHTDWQIWLEDNVGELGDNWTWSDEISGFYVYFTDETDAAAYELVFGGGKR